MRVAPPRTFPIPVPPAPSRHHCGMIQQLAGHKNLSTTQGYMHLSPTASDSAIRLLDERIVTTNFGDILETVKGEKAK